MTGEKVLTKALEIINGERRQTYGDPKDCFERIANFWSYYLDKYIRKEDVAMMMILMKVARSKNSYEQDNFVDICGYAALADEFYEKKPESKQAMPS